MIKKKITLKKQITKRLEELDIQVPNNKPCIAFIGKLSDGRYEVEEHYMGKNSNGVECTQRYVERIIDTKEEYFAQNPDWDVYYGEASMVEVLKDLLYNEPWQIAKQYSGIEVNFQKL